MFPKSLLKRLPHTVLTTAGICLIATGAAYTRSSSAESSQDQMIESRFKAADKNSDGKLTLDEAKAGMPRIANAFDKIDADNKGYVTLQQIEAIADAR